MINIHWIGHWVERRLEEFFFSDDNQDQNEEVFEICSFSFLLLVIYFKYIFLKYFYSGLSCDNRKYYFLNLEDKAG